MDAETRMPLTREDPRLAKLLSRTRRLRFGLSAVTLAMFFGFVLITSTKAGHAIASLAIGGIPLIMILAFLLIAAVVALTCLYVVWSNREIDPAVAALRLDIKP